MHRLREAELGDCQAICELAATLVGFDADRRACFKTTLADPDHDIVVAEVDDAVVGYAHLMVYPDLTHGALAGELLGIIVRADVRRQGVATALMREVIRLARERGAGEFHINTEADNTTAKALYASSGAEVVGVQMEIELE
jgi:ribosomal protein S18 acetylase RimI-like enzyme